MTTQSVTFSSGKPKVGFSPRVCPCGRKANSFFLGGVRRYRARCSRCLQLGLNGLSRVAGPRMYTQLRVRMFRKDACQSCQYAPVTVAELELDHILPRSHGGTDTEQNLQTLCAVCHKKKSILDADPHHESYYTILESAPGIRLSDKLHQGV